MSFTSDRFCVSLRKNSDDADIRKFVDAQKSLSSSIRLLIKAYMATAKKMDVESADLFDVIDSVSVDALKQLSSEIIDSEKSSMPVGRARKIESVSDTNSADPGLATVIEEKAAENIPEVAEPTQPEAAVVPQVEEVKSEPAAEPVVTGGDADTASEKKTSVADFMGDF